MKQSAQQQHFREKNRAFKRKKTSLFSLAFYFAPVLTYVCLSLFSAHAIVCVLFFVLFTRHGRIACSSLTLVNAHRKDTLNRREKRAIKERAIQNRWSTRRFFPEETTSATSASDKAKIKKARRPTDAMAAAGANPSDYVLSLVLFFLLILKPLGRCFWLWVTTLSAFLSFFFFSHATTESGIRQPCQTPE